MMNESITCEEVLHLARHLHACMDEVVKSLQLLAAGADGVVLSARSAGAFRTLADYIEWPPSMAATKAGITLRRAADQIAPTAEPDLTTVEGWNEVARRWLADGPPPGWRGHTDRLEVANLRFAVIRSYEGSNIHGVLSDMLHGCRDGVRRDLHGACVGGRLVGASGDARGVVAVGLVGDPKRQGVRPA
jgi:hypothetical protein